MSQHLDPVDQKDENKAKLATAEKTKAQTEPKEQSMRVPLRACEPGKGFIEALQAMSEEMSQPLLESDCLQTLLLSHPGLQRWLSSADVDDELRLAAILRYVMTSREELTDPDMTYGDIALLPLRRRYEDIAAELSDAFDQDLAFGTAGLRALVEPGFNRLNRYTVQLASAALAQVLCNRYSYEEREKRPVVIGFDARYDSADFARLAAEQLALQGLQVRLDKQAAPTPRLAYSIRPLNALAGLMVTASHNDRRYNGLKLYGEDGIQCDPTLAAEVAAAMKSIKKLPTWPEHAFDREEIERHIRPLDASLEQDYLDAIVEEIKIFREASVHEAARVWRQEHSQESGPADLLEQRQLALAHNLRARKELKIGYSAMKGVGGRYVPSLLERLGYRQTMLLEAHLQPDPDFEGIEQPNPELPETMQIVLDWAEPLGLDLVLVTDPDSDRLAVAARDAEGNLRAFNGNQLGALLLDGYEYARRISGTLPEPAYFANTLVSDNFALDIAKKRGLVTRSTRTGFKNICEVAREAEEASGSKDAFLMGFEESIGYCLGTRVLDKDGVQAAAWVAQLAERYKAQGATLWQRLTDLEQEFGAYRAHPIQLRREGAEGKQLIDGLMIALRQPEHWPKTIAGLNLRLVEDFEYGKRYTLKFQEERSEKTQHFCAGSSPTKTSALSIDELSDASMEPLQTNLLRFFYGKDDTLTFAARPSGTEAKIKFYLYAHAAKSPQAEAQLQALQQELEELLARLEKEIQKQKEGKS